MEVEIEERAGTATKPHSVIRDFANCRKGKIKLCSVPNGITEPLNHNGGMNGGASLVLQNKV